MRTSDSDHSGDPVLRPIPVVILTSSQREVDRAKAYSHFVNSYLVKPRDLEEFRKMVEDLNLSWAVWNRAPVPDEPPAEEPTS